MSEVDLTANDRRVIDLVRLVLAKESVKKPIRREEISEYIGNFTDKDLRKKAFELANEHLKKYFGMEIVPLPNTQSNFSVPAGTRTKGQKQSSATSNQPPNMYIVVSTLKPEERALIPSNTKNPERLALLHIVLTLVKVNANRIEHMVLRNQLLDCSIISSSPNSPVSPDQLESYLDEWREQRYLVRSKRVDDQVSEYCWGPRAYIEFPVNRVADLIINLAASGRSQEVDDRRLRQNITKALSR